MARSTLTESIPPLGFLPPPSLLTLKSMRSSTKMICLTLPIDYSDADKKITLSPGTFMEHDPDVSGLGQQAGVVLKCLIGAGGMTARV